MKILETFCIPKELDFLCIWTKRSDFRSFKKFNAVEQKGYIVQNLTEHIVISAEQVATLMANAEKNRHYGRTEMNEWSSRSHVIFQLVRRFAFLFSLMVFIF